jgi:diguanylate cyclase (GGDEF)-like protein/PAS domain S-box-containing protein
MRRQAEGADKRVLQIPINVERQPALFHLRTLARQLFRTPLVMIVLKSDQPLRDAPPLRPPNGVSERTRQALLRHLAANGCFQTSGKQAAGFFADSPALAGLEQVGFVAGAPLLSEKGDEIGGLFLVDSRARRIKTLELERLATIAALAAQEIDTWASAMPLFGGFPSLDSWQSRYLDLFEHAADLVLCQDLRGNITAVNQAAERLIGQPRTQLLGRQLADVLDAESREVASQMVLSQYGGGGPESYQLTIVTHDGQRRHIDFRTNLMFERGMPSGLIIFGRDITALKQEIAARKEAETQLRRRMEELSLFGSHLAELFRLQTSEHPSDEDFLQDCLLSGRRILRMTGGLLCRRQEQDWTVESSAAGGGLDLPSSGATVQLAPLDEIAAGRPFVCGSVEGSVQAGFQFRSYLAAPVYLDGALHGALVFLSPLAREPASGQDEEILIALATVVGRGLAQRKLREERRLAASLRQEMMKGLEMVARQSPLDEVLRNLCLAIERLLPNSKCAVALLDKGRTFWTIAPSLPYQVGRRMEQLALNVQPIRDSLRRGEAAAGRPIRPDVLAAAVREDQDAWSAHCADIRELKVQLAAALPIVSGRDEVRALMGVYGPAGELAHPLPAEVLEGISRVMTLALEQSDHSTQLRYLVRRDPLTGLPNRTRLLEHVQERLRKTAAQGGHIALALLDLDGFSLLNEALGAHMGDQVLRAAAARLQSWAPANAFVARTAGDDFAVVLADFTGVEEAEKTTRQLLEEFRRPFPIDGDDIHITASIGVSVSPTDGTQASELLGNAESALRRAKRTGKNDVVFFTPAADVEKTSRRYLGNALHGALEAGEFRLSYQPQWSREGRVEVVEVLLGWDSPRYGRIPASEFIPVAEENGMIVPIGNWVLQEVCARCALWRQEGLAPVRLAVNVSALQFARSDFFDRIVHTLQESGVEPSFIELEITESVIMRNLEDAARRIARLRGLGVRISIDDFGTGYSSLSYLRELPVDALKIDKSFLQGLAAPSAALSLVQSIVSMAHKIGLRVVAEGVETEHQRILLLQAGCDRLQGNFLSRPLNEEQVRRLLPRSQAHAASD